MAGRSLAGRSLAGLLDLVHKDTDSARRPGWNRRGGSGGTRLNFHEYALERHAADQSPEWRAKIQRGVTIRGAKFPSPAVRIGTGLRKKSLDYVIIFQCPALRIRPERGISHEMWEGLDWGKVG